MYNILHNRKISTFLSRILIICLSVLGGYGGEKLYDLNTTVKEQKIVADRKREEIQNNTKSILKNYSGSVTDSTTKEIVNQKDASKIAEQAANLVSTKLINNSISGLATKEEVQALEKKISDMFSSYELSDSQKEDLSKTVTSIIELDLNSLSKDSNAHTALSDAARKNIEDLQTKATSLQSQIDEINNKLSSITTETNKLQGTIASFEGYATSDKTSTMQSKVDELTKQYEDILSKYNKQTDKIQSLIKNNTTNANAEALEEQITTLHSSLSKLQESATSEVSALKKRIEELKTSSTGTIIDELRSKISEQQDQISTYKDNIKDLKRTMTDLNTQLNAISDDNGAREKINQQLKDNTNLINQNQSKIDSANSNISDMEEEISKLKNGTADSIGTLQNQIATITSSLTEMDSTQQTLDDLLNNLKSTIGNPDESAPGTILSNLTSTQSTLSMLEGRIDELEKKTQNIKSGVHVPFSFGVQNGKYGYFDENAFVDFKSQSDIENAVADAAGNMTGTAEKDKYIVTTQGTPEYKTDNIKNNFVVSLVGSKDPEGNYVLKANGDNVHTLYKQVQAIGRAFYGRGSLKSSKVNAGTRLPMSDYKDTDGYYRFNLGYEEQIFLSAGYYDAPINVCNGVFKEGKFKATTRSMSIDMGENTFYRYVDTQDIPNNNSRAYIFPSGKGEEVDLGITNNYRYVNAKNVYYTGLSDGKDTAPLYNLMVGAGMYGGGATASSNSVTLTNTNAASSFINVRNYNYVRIQASGNSQCSITYIREDGSSYAENKFNFTDITVRVNNVSFVLIAINISNGSNVTISRS